MFVGGTPNGGIPLSPSYSEQTVAVKSRLSFFAPLLMNHQWTSLSQAVDLETDGVALVNRIKSCIKKISLEFTQWEDPHAQGPGLYFVVRKKSGGRFTEPMGTNRWPVEECGSVFAEFDALVETARNVAFARDGAVIVYTDGVIEEQMVRVKQLSDAELDRTGNLAYAGWMDARHISALETSTRDEVFATITLSEKDGRLTVFTDGTFEDHHRGAFGELGHNRTSN